ncbi:MAG: hypothetical protein FWE36_02035 [Erysipelotrichales bacterium]|nr:hypothetical protein [Erysipelotrichales bacterium]
MEIFVWETENHMQVNELNMDNKEAFQIFWQDIIDKYRGFKIDFCFHNCDVPIDYMLEIKATMLESCLETRLYPENYKPISKHKLELVTEDNFNEFANLHDKLNPAMYWTSERIRNDFKKWLIYKHENNYVLMRLGVEIAEIYAVETNCPNLGKSLISEAVKSAIEAGKTSILQMVDENNLTELEMVKAIGFSVCGTYIAYQTIVG